MLQLAAPLWLLALPLPLLLWWQRQRLSLLWRRRNHDLALHHPDAALLIALSQQTPQPRHIPWFWLCGVTLLMTALLRPQWVDSRGEDLRYGRDIMVALDLSGSTRAEDFVLDGKVVNRLEIIKKTASDFISQRHGDRIGVTLFGDDAYTLIPLTSDLKLVTQLLKELQNNFVGEKTALGDAIALAVKRLVQSTPRERVLLLFTDGANTAGRLSPAAALQLAQTQQVRIYTIGVGSHRRVAFPQAILEQPELTTLPFDEALLQQLATATEGRYFAAEESSALANIAAEIDRLERTTRSDAPGATRELYWLPLLLGLALLYLDHWRQRRHPPSIHNGRALSR